MQFHVLSFEGPDAYSRVGGIATRVEGLTETLAAGGDANYWQTDQHINLEGNRLVAERLAATIAELLD